MVLALAFVAGQASGMTGQLTAQAADTGDTEESVGGDLMKGKFSSLTIYRWTRATGSMPKFEVPTNVMFVHDGSYLAARSPEDIYGISEVLEDLDKTNITMGFYEPEIDNHDGYEGVPKNLEGWKEAEAAMIYHGYQRPEFQAYLITADSAYKFAQKDPMIKLDRDAFYTDDHRNTPYLKYTNVYKNGEYDFYFSKDANDPNAKKYWLSLNPHSMHNYERKSTNSPFLLITNKDGWSNIIFEAVEKKPLQVKIEGSQSHNPSAAGLSTYGYYNVVICKYPESDDPSDTVMGKRQSVHPYDVYIAEALNFSKLSNDTTIGDGQVLSLSSTGYIDANGKEVSTKGCFIQNGQTLTINKGGVLSISGDLINNGTIVNNGGTILIQDGGTISSFLAGSDIGENGCGTIKCNKGDILIEKGGALYAGMTDANCKDVPFYLDNSSTLINCGLLVYGTMRLGEGARVELRSGSKSIGGCVGYAEKVTGEQYITTFTRLRSETPSFSLAAYIEDKDHYRVEQSEEKHGKTTYIHYKVYKKNVETYNDTDYDILSYYNDKILKASSGIPADCKGLHIDKRSGMFRLDGGVKNTTVLKFSGAVVEDTSYQAKELITTKDGL